MLRPLQKFLAGICAAAFLAAPGHAQDFYAGKTVNLIVGCQNYDGGWRYEPRPTGADISVTIMQVMALRAAKNAGLHVKDEVLNKAIGYIKSCYNEYTGGFTYMPGSGSPGLG